MQWHYKCNFNDQAKFHIISQETFFAHFYTATYLHLLGAYYHGSAYYGQGQGSIILDDVVCDGSEALLYQQCSHSTPLSHNCRHYEDVGVVCPSTCK